MSTAIKTPDSMLKWKNPRMPQYIACAIVSVGAFCLGNVLGWSSPALQSLQNSGDFVYLTETDVSWIGSLATIGAAVGAPIAGFCIQKIGRKYTVLVSILPMISGWLPLAIATKMWMLYLGRFFTGLGMGSLCLVLPVYLSEISEPDIRGRLCTTWNIMTNVGILFAYVVGSLMEYNVLSGICGVIPILCGVFLGYLPESPRYYLVKDDFNKAIEALCWLRASDKKCPSIEVLQEMREMEDILIRTREGEGGNWREVIKPLGIVLGIMGFDQLSGGSAFAFYTVMIFEAVGPSMDSFMAGVIVGVGQLLATILASVYVDKVGRRLLLIGSFLLMLLLLGILGVFFLLRDDYGCRLHESLNWIPLVSLILLNAVFTGGVDSLVWIVMGELLPSKSIGLCSGISTTFYWMMGFGVTRFFNDVTGALGHQNTFWCFTGFCGTGAMFTYFVVPETKGRTLGGIQKENFENMK